MSSKSEIQRPRGEVPPSSSADLLELVRSAEEEATVSAHDLTPATLEAPPEAAEEEFVDVGDEAVDAPPSLAPLRVATPAAALRLERSGSVRTDSNTRVGDGATLVLPPVVGISLMFMLVFLALVLVTR